MLKKEKMVVGMQKINLSILVICIAQYGCASQPNSPSNTSINLSGSIEVLEAEVANYNPQTGLGCNVTPEEGSQDMHVLCRSRRSAEKAWDAVTAKSKELCISDKWKMLFERDPALPKDGDVYRAQMDIRCVP